MSKTFEYVPPGPAQFSAHVTDQYGLRSDTRSANLTVLPVDPPSAVDLEAWSEQPVNGQGYRVYVRFTASFVPGQDPVRCEISIQKASRDACCRGTVVVSADVPSGGPSTPPSCCFARDLETRPYRSPSP